MAFVPPPSSETLRLNQGSRDSTVGSGNGLVPGFTIGVAAADGTIHDHLNSFLQGSDGNSDPTDGNNPADGIYLVAWNCD